MIKRYSHIQFIERYESDEVSMMFEIECGEYVKYSDYRSKLNLAIEGFKNLKHCRIGENSATELNEYVVGMIESLQ